MKRSTLSSFSVRIIALLFQMSVFAADVNQVLLNDDSWVRILNLLSVENQLNFATTCKYFKALYDENGCNYDGYTINSDSQINAKFKKTLGQHFTGYFLTTLPNFIHTVGDNKKGAGDAAEKCMDEEATMITHMCTKISNSRIGGSLDLKNINSSEIIARIFTSLSTNKYITSLGIFDCIMGKKEVKQLINALEQNNTIPLKTLIITTHYKFDADNLTCLLHVAPQLEELSCTRVPYISTKKGNGVLPVDRTDEEMASFGTSIMKLKKVSLIDCGLTYENVGWLIEALKKNQSLEELILRKNHISDLYQGMLQLRQAADTPENPLQKLDLSEQQLSRRRILPYQVKRENLNILI